MKYNLLFITLLVYGMGWGQVTLPHYDSLNYTIGQGLQTQTGWTILNSGDDLLITSGSLSYSGLESSNGNKVNFDGSGIDAAKLFTQQTSGVVYFSFLLNVTSLGSITTTGGYFTGFNEGTATNYGGTVWIRSDGSGYDIGINPRTTAANTVWSSGTQILNTTLLVVISYQIVTGTANDIVNLWINPIPGQSLPSATLTATNTGTDLINLNRVLLRQDSGTTTPFIQMDEFRIGTTWSSVTPVSNSAPVASIVNFSGTTNVGQTLTGSYSYTDADSDVQGTSTFKWYRADDASGTNNAAISGATAATYTLQAADVNKYISFGVVPVAATGTSPGVEAFSAWQGPITYLIWNGTSWSNGTGPTVSLDAIIDGDLTTSGDLTCKDLTINSGKTLTVAAGTTLKVSGNLVNNGSIVFKSNNTSTGRFDSYSGNPITGTGTVTMERFIDGKRAYRLLAPGVTTSGTIANNWQQQVYITGSTTGANGFDATTTGNPSMFTYGDAGWASIGNTNVLTLDAEKGYRILIRGDRTPSILTSPSNGNMNTSVTLSATGTMKTGNVVYNTLSSQDYTLVANPYISPINWATVTKSGISDTYYVWDPNLGTGNQRGRYVSCDIAGTTSIISGSGSPSTDVDQYIQPGQAFFIQKITSGVNGSITVKETDKATTFTDVFRTTNASANNTSIDGKLGINLYESLAYSLGEYPIDGAVAVNGAGYNTYSSADDINKIMSHGEQVAFVRDNMQLGVEKVSAPQATDELSIASINLLANKSYTWSVVLQDNFSSEDAYLYDAFTQSYHPLNASNTTVVPFETTTDVASINSNRFKIVFQNTALTSPIFDNLIGLYPNPSNGANGFYITNVTANAKVELFTLLGQSVSVTTALNGTIVQVKPISEVAKGIYVVQVTSEDGLTKQVKWIVE